jgi:hypothetical protein
MANLSWARNAVMEAAIREIEWEALQATDPRKCPEKGGVFPPTSSRSDLTAPDHVEVAAEWRDWPPSDDGGAS